MKYYTLYYQPQTSSNRVIAVASSNSLLKLCKIRKMTFRIGNGHFCIVETKDADDELAFTYDEGWLFDYEREDFNRFSAKVDNGKYYKTYDYIQRVRELLNRRV